MARTSPDLPAWTQHDSALWYTCEIVADLVTGQEPQVTPGILAPFPPSPPDRCFWASGDFTLLDLRASGDGSYMHNGGFFFATGGVGLAVTAVAAAGRAAGNSARRNAAAAAAVPRWTPIDNGQLYVAPSSFTMHAPGGVNNWYYTSLDTAQMVGPGQMHFQGSSMRGPISWILMSDWAELVFVTWALRQHPRHPQLLGGGWLPPGWLQRCRQHQHNTRLATPELA